jgi:lysophospholipase L1-like esterase
MRVLALSLMVLGAAVSAQTPPASPASTTAPAPQAPQGGGRGAPAPLPDLTCTDLAAALRNMNANDPRVRDWPAMSRYREFNHSVKDAKVVFMGDSITDNWQQPRFGGFFPGKAYVDRGIGGQTTPQMVLRFRNDVINLKPKAVVILAGTNDIAGNTGPMSDDEIEGNLATMSELAHAHQIKVVFSSITPVSGYHLATPTANPQTSQRPLERIHAINDWMKKYAADHGDVYLDYFSAMVDDKGLLRAELSADDLHPTTAGYAIMGPLAEAAIAKAIK